MSSGAAPEVLLQGLALFLGDTVRPAIDASGDKGLAFRVRIAQHLTMSLALELQSGEGHDRAAIARLDALLGTSSTPSTASEARTVRAHLEAQLATSIDDGTAVDEVLLHDHLHKALADELSVTNPRFDLSQDLP